MSRKLSNFQKRIPSRFVFGEHDDRTNPMVFLRRVTHGTAQSGHIGRKGHDRFNPQRLANRLRNWAEDGDIDDAMQPGGSGFKGRGRGRGGRRGGKAFPSDITTTGSSIRRGHWYQITVNNGNRYTRDEVLMSLQNFLQPQTFVPVCYQIVRNDSQFFVETWPTAQMLLSCTRKIQMKDNQPLVLRIKDYKPPFTPIDDVITEKIKQVMAKRYVAANKALDLSSFVRDPDFLDGLFCALNRAPILATVVKIMKENIPDLVALNLSGNQIVDFEAAVTDIPSLKNLKILHLSDNQISQLGALNCFKTLDISELTIDRNPISTKFPDHSHFVRYDTAVTELRRRFPKLEKLDNTPLLAPVTFDVAEEGHLPNVLPACICVPEGRDFVTAFLSQYFKIYDSDNRTELTQAYSENAIFSIIAQYPPPSVTNGPRLNAYFSDSRNLMRITDYQRRKNRLLIGRDIVVDFLHKQLPKTEHDLPSFLVDLTFFMPELIQLSVCGIFRETGVGSPASWPLRYFSRTFLIVPVGTGFCIANDMLMVSNCTEDQKKAAFTAVPEKPAAPISSPVASASPVATAAVPDETVKLQMVHTVAQQTGMNLDWSRKCLEETNWDFQRAAFTFNELQNRGAIPAEAFIK